MRWYLIALLVAAACASDAARPPAADQPAGKVIAVSGSVTATRPGAPPRTLTPSDVVHGDDTIETGAGASVDIQLAHNGARFVLAADERRRLDESVAWTAAGKVSAGLLDRDEIDRTEAAGRHSEREAAETAAPATTPRSPSEPPPGTAVRSEPEMVPVPVEPPPGAKHVTGDGGGSRETSAATLDEAPAAPDDRRGSAEQMVREAIASCPRGSVTGTLAISLRIAPSGDASDVSASIRPASAEARSLADCVRKAISSAALPAGDKSLSIKLKIDLATPQP